MTTLLADAAQQPWWAPLVQTALGGGLAIVGAFIATWWGETLKEHRERRQVAAAFAGDISALRSVVVLRNYEALLRENISCCIAMPSASGALPQVGNGPRTTHWVNPLPIRGAHLGLFDNNVGRLGSLPPSIARVIAGDFDNKASTLVGQLEKEANQELEDTLFK